MFCYSNTFQSENLGSADRKSVWFTETGNTLALHFSQFQEETKQVSVYSRVLSSMHISQTYVGQTL